MGNGGYPVWDKNFYSGSTPTSYIHTILSTPLLIPLSLPITSKFRSRLYEIVFDFDVFLRDMEKRHKFR